MKRMTRELVSTLVNETMLEYTKNRFISEEEIAELEECLSVAIDLRLTKEDLSDCEIGLSLSTL